MMRSMYAVYSSSTCSLGLETYKGIVAINAVDGIGDGRGNGEAKKNNEKEKSRSLSK